MVWDTPPETKELTELDRQVIGARHKRLTIPLENKLLLRQVADILRGLANQIDFDSRRPDTTERTALLDAKHSIDCTNRKIRALAEQHGVELREGRPKGTGGGEHRENRNGTVSSRAAGVTLHAVD